MVYISHGLCCCTICVLVEGQLAIRNEENDDCSVYAYTNLALLLKRKKSTACADIFGDRRNLSLSR